ncbi:MAG: RecQ family ATP-dependent DNA helicase, partial [Acidobacteriota bacterium]|nr:RecQ family ATP-dependent DNA helicase [Acidobacteriota bacterium]
MPDLASLLHRTFGHSSFRANQEAVCRAATDGRDVLLVMPTGAGKSLCYQLPAIARGGTALVVSPLIALMDDQAAKLSANGLRVARIHSGLSREDSRQACQNYLAGTLDFLFIAPERLRVPGFPEMLARRKLALIAIDEAHCISAWGHDFRPDYRTLGEHLPALRPAPIIALTATATPTVQQDIVAQLHLQNPALFIHGFRRSNLAIEVVEMSKPRRHEFTTQLLSNPANRPAIVYAPSRKAAEELAAELNRAIKLSGSELNRPIKPCAPFIESSAMSGSELTRAIKPCAPFIESSAMSGSELNRAIKPCATIAAAYHAGLEPSVRERVQQAFQSGKLEVVVATIAFGMGIDKADVRTVVHTALPASVEAFYQEIGRAGRDGLPSRTVLLHSYADRKMHEFFLDRDYPPATDLARVAQVLTDEYLMPEPLAQRLKMDFDTFSKSIEKLIGQGAATIDPAGNVRATPRSSTPDSWRSGYDAQIAFRRSQIDRMSAYAETQQCRMTAVIRHFGDTADAHRPCGLCDFCSPSTTSAQTFAPPTTDQARDLRAILRVLESRSTSTGKLHTELGNGTDRHTFDVLLDALARAGLITLTTDTFTSKDDGRVIPYKKAALTHEGRSEDASELADVLLPAEFESDGPASRSSRKSKRAIKSTSRKSSPDASANLTPVQKQLEEALRAWRKSEAAKTGKPAFIVLSDAVLRNIATAEPQSIPELLTVPGIGPNKADQFGATIIALCRNPSAELAKQSEKLPRSSTQPASSRPKLNDAEKSAQLFRSPAKAESEPATFHRTRPVESDPTAALTTEQQLLDSQLRVWRKAESERMGLPQSFVLGSSTLRSIVLTRPRNLEQL